jgi:hypothetical protein
MMNKEHDSFSDIDSGIFEEDTDPVEIEGYCVRCRETVTMEDPHPVWTRKGQPATQGDCPMCGGSVFRLGKTELHQEKSRPTAVVVAEEKDKRNRPQLARDTVYINFTEDDSIAAKQLAVDLTRAGLAVWLHDISTSDALWTGGVHPALRECARMVLVLSPQARADAKVTAAWQFFKQNRKPIIIAQVANAEPPDTIRRSPRYDFTADYKTALRQMLNVLSA